MNKKVLILGCGPAGLMAAHAASMRNADVKIISKKRKSHLFGCQYLHAPIPLVTGDNSVKVEYVLQGSHDKYRAKVYEGLKVQTSTETLDANHEAWDIRDTYDRLWDIYHPYIIDYVLPQGLRDDMLDVVLAEADLVFSTIPAPALCRREGHQFSAQKIWAMGDAPERGQRVPFQCKENVVVCNGEDSPSWYRMSRVFGHTTVEWPGGKKPPIEGVVEVPKPIKTDCDCHPNITRLGRYGKWEKGVLSHSAFEEVYNTLEDWRLF